MWPIGVESLKRFVIISFFLVRKYLFYIAFHPSSSLHANIDICDLL